METISEIASLNTSDLNDDTIENIYNNLIKTYADDVPKKILRKILEITFFVLKYKGEQVSVLQEQTDSKSFADGKGDDANEQILEENERLNRLIGKLETEKTGFKSKMREMNDEIISLQKKLHEISAESDKDSSDPLSELGRQEELLKNISTKNKHIKRLLRDIENLQLQNIEQSKTIMDLENKLQLIKSDISSFQNQLSICNTEKKELNNNINEHKNEITRLEGNITYLEDEREKADIELKDFIEKLEERARSWRNIIDEKENQLDSLRKKYELLKSDNPKMMIETDEQDNQFEKLVEAVQERDTLIEELENKLKSMAEEMISSTRIMNQISAERETDKLTTIKKNKSCCAVVEESLVLSQKRCKNLSDMLEKIEDDNIIKSKQTIDAINALDAYQKGEDGLKNSLNKIGKLERKLNSRDKHIKALVMELNSLHEISQENSILRKKLNIPDDFVIATNNLVAKQRSKDKMLERLNLKLRASEEIRLQLKLESTELKKEIINLRKKLSSTSKEDDFIGIKDGSLEIRKEIYCDNCLKNIQTLPNNDTILKYVVKEWEEKYSSVIEENENLRVGMHEILEKIREYEISSDHITIDCSILEKVLHALDARSISGWYHPAMRMQNELIAVKEREQALKEKINLVGKVAAVGVDVKATNITGEIDRHSSATFSVSSRSSNGNLEDENMPHISKSPKKASDNKQEDSAIQQLFPMIIEQDIEQENMKMEFLKISEKNCQLLIENETLTTYKLQYLEMIENFKSSDSDITKYCSNLVENLTNLEIKYKTQNKKYEFLKDDYNQTLTDYKFIESKNINLITELKKEVNNKKHELNLIKLIEKKKIHKINNDEIIILRKKYSQLECRMADLIGKIFNGKIPEFQLNEPYNVVGIIKENIHLDYLTYEEYEDLKNSNNKLKETNDEMLLKCQHLQDSLAITQDQVKLHQKLISEITDNHIELRHLVADLQSTSEEKFLVSKCNRDLKIAKKEIAKLLSEKELLENNTLLLKDTIQNNDMKFENMNKEYNLRNINNELKLKFIQNYTFNIQAKYCKYTPLINLADFMSSYSKFSKKSNNENKIDEILKKKIDNVLSSKLEKSSIESQDLIKLVKYETKCSFLEEQLLCCQQNLEITQKELDELRMSVLENNEEWKTIQILFGDEKIEKLNTISKYIQTDIEIVTEMKDFSTNTDPISETTATKLINSTPKKSPIKVVAEKESKVDLSSPEKLSVTEHLNNTKALETQLKDAMKLASERNISILETENKLSEATGRIIEMEKIIKSLNDMLRSDTQSAGSKASDMIETTINSLQSLISEKENRLNDYQNLLKIEKEQHIKSCENYNKELDALRKSEKELENIINSKNSEIDDLKIKIETKSRKGSHENGKLELPQDHEFDGNCDNSLNEISDEKIEEMFMDESKNLTNHTAIQSTDETSPIRQTNDIKNHFKFWEKTMKAKDEEITLLKDKLSLQQERERIDACENPEIDQLRIMLEEKDKHINDLMETLTSFHDDQQRFLSETSLYSADQMTQLGSDLTRSVTTNKILQTQIEALKRQLASLTQREKQARDLANTLKNQLIKRPVVSIKTELNSRTKTEQQQKRIVQLESELAEAKKEIVRQQSAIDAKRAKNATEVSLWEKQKRYQQNAEKLKIKLDDTEKSLERARTLLTSARTTITRLEKEKNSIETKSKAANLNTCCRTPSCPNLFMTKYSLIESSENQTPGYSDSCSSQHSIRKISLDHSDIVNQLKSQIEAQQRRIYAYELACHGSNALTTEIEKLQEKLSAAESQNIRWEAKNLQLQLDNDLLRQGNENDRMKKQIKHLEDYIVALKEELAQVEAEKELNFNDSQFDKKTTITGNSEQTILALKRIVEKLKVENKNLKDGRSYYQCTENKNREQSKEMSKLHHSYAEALNKISALQIELQLKDNSQNNNEIGGGDFINEFRFVKEQLIKKTQLLEKAKVLLTRAAAKEKSLKEQIAVWKRKCSELQNVPVIDEISE